MYCQYTISCGKLRITVTNGYNPSRHQPEERWDTVMENRLDIEKTVAIITGTVFMIMIYMYLAMETTVPGYVEIQICVAIITVLAAIYGSVAGILIPLASYIAVYVSNPRDGLLSGLLFLVFFGLGTGHFASRFKIRVGRFRGMSLADYAVVEAFLAVIVWVCVQPLCSFYFQKTDLRITLNDGVMNCALTLAIELCIVLPVLLLANRLYGKRQEAIDAKNDYLYERK